MQQWFYRGRALALAAAALTCSGSVEALAWARSNAPVQYRSYQKELDCLAKAVYFEARGEPAAGQQAVAQVILNRVDSPFYPDTICDVVYQNDHMKNACQFSFACDGEPDRVTEPRAFRQAMATAVALFECDKLCRKSHGAIARSTHYHADYVSPSWSAKLQRTGNVGRHIFYYTASN
jgi:spore germination cell wall hydrolase CwlJ-like protein